MILYSFNHKTGAEDVHFTSAPSLDESDESAESVTDDENDCNDEEQIQTPQPQENVSSARSNDEGSSDGPNSECSEDVTGNPMVLKMILVKDVEAGTEVHASRLSHHYLLFVLCISLCFFSRAF